MDQITRLLAGVALVAFLGAMAAIAIQSAVSDGGAESVTTTRLTTRAAVTTRPPTTPAKPRTQQVKLIGSGAYDPEGDRRENDDLAPLAVDGNATTFWRTEHYRNGFFKTGVGLLLDMGRTRRLSRVTVSTDAAGSSARIELGNGPDGPFRPVSAVRPLTGTTAFPVRPPATGRYLVVWITAIPREAGEAHITEVRATATR